MNEIIRAIIFDLNGVLIDSMPCYLEAYRIALAKAGVKMKDEEFLSRVRFSSQEVISQILAEHGANADVKALSKEVEQFVESHIVEMSVLKPNANEALRRLERDFLVAIATSARRSAWKKLERKFGLKAGLILTADDVDAKSIKPAVFLKAAEKLGVKHSEAAVVEDSPENIAQVQQIGMKAIGIAGTHLKSRLKHADWVVSDLGEITPELIR